MSKVTLKSPSGKEVAFAPNQVEYMKKHGWTQVEKPKAKPSEGKSK